MLLSDATAAWTLTMSNGDDIGPDRVQLNFANAVSDCFAFLGDFGFTVAEQLPTIVRYRKHGIEVDAHRLL